MNSDSLLYLYKQKKTEHWITWSDDDDGTSYADWNRLRQGNGCLKNWIESLRDVTTVTKLRKNQN